MVVAWTGGRRLFYKLTLDWLDNRFLNEVSETKYSTKHVNGSESALGSPISRFHNVARCPGSSDTTITLLPYRVRLVRLPLASASHPTPLLKALKLREDCLAGYLSNRRLTLLRCLLFACSQTVRAGLAGMRRTDCTVLSSKRTSTSPRSQIAICFRYPNRSYRLVSRSLGCRQPPCFILQFSTWFSYQVSASSSSRLRCFARNTFVDCKRVSGALVVCFDFFVCLYAAMSLPKQAWGFFQLSES